MTDTSVPPKFTQCPAVGENTGCAILIVINADGSVTILTDDNQGPYDGSEDTLVGVQNNMKDTFIQGITLSAPNTNEDAPFDFDGDGICDDQTPAPSNPSCDKGGFTDDSSNPAFGTTGYEGPNTNFSNISADFFTGTVNFTAVNPLSSACPGQTGNTSTAVGIAPGASAYFSLEGVIDATTKLGNTGAPTAQACPPAVVQGESVTPPVVQAPATGPELARTGQDSKLMAEFAVLLVLVGGALVLASRRIEALAATAKHRIRH